MGYALDGWGSIPGTVMTFLFSIAPILALGSTQPPTQWELGALFSAVKLPGREAEHSAPYVFMA
jgi:hypothetical protein